jgi:hypothetical protein
VMQHRNGGGSDALGAGLRVHDKRIRHHTARDSGDCGRNCIPMRRVCLRCIQIRELRL